MRGLTLLAGALLAVPLSTGLAGASSSAGSADGRWVITDLGAAGEAVAINEHGQVVGWSENGSGDRHAFQWENGKMRDLGTLGGPNSEAVAVNGSGQVVGWADTEKKDTHGYPIRHAFLWENGKMRDLGGPESGAVAVDGSGQVAGWRWADMGTKYRNPASHGFLWENGKMLDLGGLPGGGETDVFGMNEGGQVVGIARAATRRWHAVLWQHGRIVDLRIPPAGLNGAALAITDRGQIVGTRQGVQRHVFVWKAGRRTDLPVNAAPTHDYGLLDFSSLAIDERGDVAGTTGYPKHAFLWHDGKVRVLKTLGGRYSISAGISDSGQVIGQSPTADGHVQAFLWSDGHMSELSTLPGGTSSQSRAINNQNQIVGWATTKSGQHHPVLWTLKTGS